MMEPTDSKQKLSGIISGKFRKRLKPKHLSDAFRDRIVSLMTVHESADDVADVLRPEMPGITGKTVIEVMVIHRIPKPPQRATLGISIAQGMRRAG